MEYCALGLKQFSGTCYFNLSLNGLLLSPTLLQFAIKKLQKYEQNTLNKYSDEIKENFYKNTTIEIPPTWEDYPYEKSKRIILAKFLLHKLIALYLCNYNSLKHPIHYQNIPATLCKYTRQIDDIIKVDDYNVNNGGIIEDAFHSIFKKLFDNEAEFNKEVTVIDYDDIYEFSLTTVKFNKFILVKAFNFIKYKEFENILKYFENKGYFLDQSGIYYEIKNSENSESSVHGVLGIYCDNKPVIIDSQSPDKPYFVNWRNGVAIKTNIIDTPVKKYNYSYLLFVKLENTNNKSLGDIINEYKCDNYIKNDNESDFICEQQILNTKSITIVPFHAVVRKILFIPIGENTYKCLIACKGYLIIYNYKNKQFIEEKRIQYKNEDDNTIYNIVYDTKYGIILTTHNKILFCTNYINGDINVLNESYKEIYSIAIKSTDKTIIWSNKNILNAFRPGINLSTYFKTEQHTGTIYKVIIHPNGRIIATASADKTIRLWDMNTGLPLKMNDTITGFISVNDNQSYKKDAHILKGHTGSVNTIAFNNLITSDTIVSGSDDKTIRVWQRFNEKGWNCSKVIDAHTAPVIEVLFSPTNPNLLASISVDKTLKLWNMETYKCIGFYSGDTHFNSIQFLPNGKELVASNIDNNLYFFYIEEIQEEKVSFGGNKLKLKKKIKK